MVRLKFEVELNVERLDAGPVRGSPSAEGVGGVGVEGTGFRVEEADRGLLGGLGGGVAVVSTRRGGFDTGVAPGRAGGKGAASWSWAASRWPSELASAPKS